MIRAIPFALVKYISGGMGLHRNLGNFVALNYSFKLKMKLIFWTIVQNFILKSVLCPINIRIAIYRFFGLTIGDNCILKRGITIQFPWNLEIGNYCWIGENVWFINHERIVIGSNVCISQRSIVCSGGHDYRSSSLEFAHKPICIKDGAWICVDAKILPGVTIGECSVVSAGEVARRSVADFSLLIEGQISAIDPPN